MNDDFYARFFGENRGGDDGNYGFSFDEVVVKEAKRTFSRLFLALFSYLLISVVLINATAVALLLVNEKAYDAVFGTELGQSILNAVVQYLIALPVFWLIVRKMDKETPFVYNSITPREFISFFLIAQILMTIGNYVGLVFNSTVGSYFGTEVINHTAESIERSPIWVSIIFAVILAPIAEELLMRKLFIDRLAKYGTGFAVIVSALAFGIFHGNFYQFFYATLSGLVLGAVYVRGGLKYSIGLHMIINLWGSVVAMLYSNSLDVLMENDMTSWLFWLSLAFVIIYSIISITMLVLGIKLLIRCIRVLRSGFDPFAGRSITLPRGSLPEIIFGNVGVILFLALSAITLVLSFF